MSKPSLLGVYQYQEASKENSDDIFVTYYDYQLGNIIIRDITWQTGRSDGLREPNTELFDISIRLTEGTLVGSKAYS